MPLFFDAYNHVDGATSKIPPGAKDIFGFAPHEKSTEIREAKDLVEAEDDKIRGGLGIAEVQRGGTHESGGIE